MRETDRLPADPAAVDAARWLVRFGWTAVAVPLVFVVALPALTIGVLEPRWPGHGHLVAAALGAAGVVAFGLAMVMLVAHAHRQMVALQHRALAAERHTAVLVERDRIAREMHDSLAQVLAVAHLRLRTLAARPAVAADPAVLDEVTSLADLCQESVRDVRETILGLRNDNRTDTTVAEGLQALLAAFSRSTGIATHLAVEEPTLDLPLEQRVQASRVVQEALANARKHSGASRVTVTMAQDARTTRLVVTDDGRGFDPAAVPADGHYGLQTMAERITQVGGRLHLVAAPGEGTSVVVELPRTPLSPQETRR